MVFGHKLRRPQCRIALKYLAVAWSLAHGAGRLVSRTQARAHGEKRYKSNLSSTKDLYTTSLGSEVICDDHDLLFEVRPHS